MLVIIAILLLILIGVIASRSFRNTIGNLYDVSLDLMKGLLFGVLLLAIIVGIFWGARSVWSTSLHNLDKFIETHPLIFWLSFLVLGPVIGIITYLKNMNKHQTSNWIGLSIILVVLLFFCFVCVKLFQN